MIVLRFKSRANVKALAFNYCGNDVAGTGEESQACAQVGSQCPAQAPSPAPTHTPLPFISIPKRKGLEPVPCARLPPLRRVLA